MLQEDQSSAALQVIEAVRAATTAPGAIRSTSRNTAITTPALWPPGVPSSPSRASAIPPSAARFASPPPPGTVFWSNGSAWGTCTRTPDANGWRVVLNILGGEVQLRAFELTDIGRAEFDRPRSVGAGDHLTLHLTA